MMLRMIPNLGEADWHTLLGDLDYLNMEEIKAFCKKQAIASAGSSVLLVAVPPGIAANGFAAH